jgi:Rieske Fe-S protein
MGNGPDSEDRRNFLRISVIGGVALIAAGGASASLFLPPALGPSVGAGPRPLAPMLKLGLLEKDKPLGLEINLSVRDGWRLRTRRQVVYVVRVAEGDTAAAFKTLSPICPHAGCSVELKETRFVCPCHGAEFKPDGAREKGPSPRDMDSLDASIADHEGKPWLFVSWQEFNVGSAERTPRGNA